MSLANTYARYPVEFVSGSGCWLVDAAGERYLDFLSGIAVNNLGHCHPAVVSAVQEQVGKLMHVSNLFYTDANRSLAVRLASRSLGGSVFFCNSGAEANEAAIKLVRKFRPRGDVVVALNAFHGRTYGALSATPQESKQAPFAPLVPGFRVVPPTAEALAGAVDERTAAVLLEPIQGESGVNVFLPELLSSIRSACDAVGAALVFDEVQTGIGRTGTLFAYEQVGVVPDAMTLAKGLGGGLPIGALVMGPRLQDVLAPGDHGSTFAGGPVVSVAAHAVLDVVDDESFLATVRARGERLIELLRELPSVLSVRGRGLMVAAEVSVDAPDVAKRALMEQKLILNATGATTLRFLPPLIVSESEIDEALTRLRAVLG
jgi:predicted acetylornithine/succinylornithine family transaminase